MSKKPKEYCTLDPDFPETCYTVIYTLQLHKDIDIIPMFQVFYNLDEISKTLAEAEDTFKENGVLLSETCMVYRITKNRLYPLKKEYWKGEHMPYTAEGRVPEFKKLMEHPEMFEILVTPSRYLDKEKEWGFTAALPMKAGTTDKVIEQFMFASDTVVEERAKSAAIYTVVKPMKYFWRKNKIEPPKSKPSSN